MDTKTKVDVLLREYDTLRQEIVSRTNNRFAMAGLLVAVAAFVISQPELVASERWGIAIVAFFVSIGGWWTIGFLIRCCAARLMEIEQRVNALVGDELLVWETRNAKRWSARFMYPKSTARPDAS